MILRFPLGGVRRFAALLLLLGVMLIGAVDAVACELDTEAVPSVTLVVGSDSQADGDHHRLPESGHDGVCIHGHCHHSVPHIQPVIALMDMPAYHADHPLPRENRLASLTSDPLKRPPRA